MYCEKAFLTKLDTSTAYVLYQDVEIDVPGKTHLRQGGWGGVRLRGWGPFDIV